MIPAFATIWKMWTSCHGTLKVGSLTTCKPPRLWIVSLTIFFTSLSWDTSAGCIYARLPLVEISRCSASNAGIWEDKSLRAMSKPSLERRRAIACPMPLEAPVTIAIPNVILNEWGNIRGVPSLKFFLMPIGDWVSLTQGSLLFSMNQFYGSHVDDWIRNITSTIGLSCDRRIIFCALYPR